MLNIKHSVFQALACVALLLPCTNVQAHINTGVMPDSYFDNKTLRENIPSVRLTLPEQNTLRAQAIEDEKEGLMPKIGKLLSVDNLTPATSGAWQQLENGTDVWRLSLSGQDALGCVIHFNRMDLPNGAKLFVYNPDGSVILGPYTRADNPDGGPFAIGMIYGEEAIVEYVAPMAKSTRGNRTTAIPDLEIGSYAYIYRDVMDLRSDTYGDSESCQVNINCSEGDNWREQQRGVAKIYVVEGFFAGYCSGTLINNTQNDGTPYFLTADHCGGSTTASDFQKWIFYFNYESAGCANSRPTNVTDIHGCTRIARSDVSGGSDFLLLQLSNTTIEDVRAFNGVYNGWDISETASPSGVGIHHPSGDIKKISTYTKALTTITYDDPEATGMSTAHWQVIWAKTENGHGVTEGGSSGSPLFNNNGLVIGTLTGGSSYCTSPTSPDAYGKMSYHWQKAGTTNATRLQPWLDPAGTATTCQLLDPCADFYVTPSEYSFPIEGGQTDILVKAGADNSQWTAQTTAEWLHLSTTTGAGANAATTMTVTADANTQAARRNATIDITHGEKIHTVTISQSGTDDISYGFSYDFENCTAFAVDAFAPCTTADRDGAKTYSIKNTDFDNAEYVGSFIAFNANETSPALDADWAAYQGDICGACFSAYNTANDDWFITPKVYLQDNSQLTFYAKSAVDTYGLERFNVLVSETSNQPDDFQLISQSPYTEASTQWTPYTFDLSAYDNKQIYVAIQCVSNDAFAFLIDDIKITPTSTDINTNLEGVQNISIAQNVVNDHLVLYLPTTLTGSTTAQIFDVTGKLMDSKTIDSQSNILPVGQLKTGIYLLRVGGQTLRFVKQ